MKTPLKLSLVPASLLLLVATHCTASDALDVLSLEDLTKTEITSVSRKSQSLARVPAAAFVISSDDIIRSGALTLPDVLRMAPGIEVAQIDNGRYAVSARGFNGRFANKLQVLVDGRSIFLPSFSGVMWEHDVIALEDIERIEIIRGPGAAMWGVNAVNGVINIISKHSRDQSGGLVSAAAGSQNKRTLYARYGGELGEDTSWKLSYQGRLADPSTQFSNGNPSVDHHNNGLVDLRIDRNLGGGSDFSLWANANRTRIGDLMAIDFAPASNQGVKPVSTMQSDSSQSLTGRYRWLSASSIESSLQMSLTESTVGIENYYQENRSTFDLDYQGRHTFTNHDLLWGLSHRTTSDNSKSSTVVLSVSPESFTQQTTGLFFQDDWTLIPDTLQFGFGTRWDHTNLGGNTLASNLTLMWTPSRVDTFWAKYGSAPRMPARGEFAITALTAIQMPPSTPVPVVTRVMPSAVPLSPEKMEGLELGYRTQLANNFNIDVSTWQYRYRDRVSGTLGTVDATTWFPFALIQNTHTCNCSNGWISGIDLSADWLVQASWRLQLTYSLTRVRMDNTDNLSVQIDNRHNERSTPHHYGSLRSQWNISPSQQFDAWLRGSAGIQRINTPYTDTVHVPGYVTLDLRYAHKLNKSLELALTGRNLVGASRIEYVSDYIPSAPIKITPSVSVSARWSF